MLAESTIRIPKIMQAATFVSIVESNTVAVEVWKITDFGFTITAAAALIKRLYTRCRRDEEYCAYKLFFFKTFQLSS